MKHKKVSNTNINEMPFKTQISNLGRTARFRNNLHQVRLQYKNRKPNDLKVFIAGKGPKQDRLLLFLFY